MSFAKVGHCQVIASGSIEPDGPRVATTKTASYYLGDGARVLDVGAILAKVAENYAISADPKNYFFEAIRANTTNAPNDNSDAFHRNELLRWNTLVGKPVYATYEEKPHHIQHRASNPKAARGVVLAAHYNAESPPMENCPTCNTRTFEREARDDTGLHCKKCGTLVKDEFVETLLGIDRTKDKRFAKAVEDGILVTASMGCNCESTTCNVCDHVAYTRAEFCPHIRSAKGTYWTKKDSNWVRTNEAALTHELSKRGMKFNANDFMRVRASDGFEARKAFEFCNNVTFDELSRVDVPADQKARSIEIIAAHTPTAAELDAETEALLTSVASKARTAAPNKQADDKSAVDLQVSPGDPPITIVPSPSDAPAAPSSAVPEAPATPPAPGAPETNPARPPPPAPGVPPEQVELNNMGLMPNPPGASKQGAWRETYRGYSVQASQQGNLRLIDAQQRPLFVVKRHATLDPRSHAKALLQDVFAHGLVAASRQHGAIWSPRLAQATPDIMDRIRMLRDDAGEAGDLEAVKLCNKALGGDKGALKKCMQMLSDTDAQRDAYRSAQVNEGGANNMVGHDDYNRVNSILDDVATDGPSRKPNKSKSVALGGETDGPQREKPTDDVAEGGAHDFAPRQPPPKSVLDGGEMAQTEVPPKRTVKDRVNEGGMTDRAAARIEKLAAAKIAAAEERARKAELELQRVQVASRKEALAHAARLMRLAASRVAPETLQMAIVASLVDARVLNNDPRTAEAVSYQGMSEELAHRLAYDATDVGMGDYLGQLEAEMRHLAERSPEYLADVEKDLSRAASRTAAPIVHAESLGVFEAAGNFELRRAAVEGNLMFTPASTSQDRGSSLRAAIGNTRVSALAERLAR